MMRARMCYLERRLFLSGLRSASAVISLICASTSSEAASKTAASALLAVVGVDAGAVACCAKVGEAHRAAKPRIITRKRAAASRGREFSEKKMTFLQKQLPGKPASRLN